MKNKVFALMLAALLVLGSLVSAAEEIYRPWEEMYDDELVLWLTSENDPSKDAYINSLLLDKGGEEYLAFEGRLYAITDDTMRETAFAYIAQLEMDASEDWLMITDGPEEEPEPTAKPTPEPTEEPTPEPTGKPTPEPTEEPEPEPTRKPTPTPERKPVETPEPEPEPEPQADLTIMAPAELPAGQTVALSVIVKDGVKASSFVWSIVKSGVKGAELSEDGILKTVAGTSGTITVRVTSATNSKLRTDMTITVRKAGSFKKVG